MKNQKILSVALIFAILGIGSSLYLANHHYSLIYAFQESSSICNIGAKFSCDAINTSRFSEVFGVPIAMFGAFTLLAQVFLLIGIRFMGESEKVEMSRYFFYLSLGAMIPAIYLAGVSAFVLKAYCIFCISLYFVFAIQLVCALKMAKKLSLPLFIEDIKSLFGLGSRKKAYGVLVVYLLIPVGGALAHGMYSSGFVADQGTLVNRAITDWMANPIYNFNLEGSPVEGSSDKFVIVEFADFQCGHCRRASHSLHAFVKANEDRVKFVFQNYPLDSTCNPKVQGKFHEHACQMAKASICGFKIGKFREVHDWIFAHQESLSSTSIDQMISELNLAKDDFSNCLQSPETSNALAAQIERANGTGIQGTPAVFVNGRMLPYGFVIPVLSKALELTH